MSGRGNGGPAFPANELNADGSLYAQHFGMTLRDYFAAKAAAALIAEPFAQGSRSTVQVICQRSGSASDAPQMYAEAAYILADAMLKERAK